jgi:hypothetical protein
MHTELARRVLATLAEVDLIAIRDHGKAVEALALVLEGVGPQAAIRTVVHFLDSSDLIDEIYGTDRELGEVIGKVLSSPGSW